MKPRPLEHLEFAGKMYPEAWRQAEKFREGADSWPSWCFIPIRRWAEIVRDDRRPHMTAEVILADAARLATIGTWRYSQGIYRFDDAVYQSLLDTQLDDKLHTELLLRMPEWSIYIETPGLNWFDSPQYGFWAMLDYDDKTERPILSLVIDSEADLAPVAMELGSWSITEALDRMAAKGAPWGIKPDPNVVTVHSVVLPPLFNLLLYACSDGVEYSGTDRPVVPTAKRTKRGLRYFPATRPRVWALGKQTGDKIREYVRSTRKWEVPPKLRRAHWHTFYRGPRDGKRELFAKFLPPIPVAGYKVGNNDLPE